jgi:uncharacterized protein
MIRVVLNTNIIISASLSKGSTPDKALAYAIDNTVLLISEESYAELEEKLLNKKFDKYVTIESRKTFLKALHAICEIVLIEKRIVACRDSKDDKFLELAVNGYADFIITGDKDLLVLHPFESIAILSPSDFLKQFNNFH